MKMAKWSSNPDLNSEKRKPRNFQLFICLASNIKKDHWEPDSQHPICYGCQRKFKFFFRRHHCRRCGKVYCFSCSGLKMRLDENAQIGNEGSYHRVCFMCYKSRDACFFNEQCLGQTTSLTNTFKMERDKELLRSSLSLMTDLSGHQFSAEAIQLCRPILEIFTRKKSSNGVLVKPVINALKKAGRESFCTRCSNHILVPKNRKNCLLCNQIFCKKCSSKRLVLFSNGSRQTLPDMVITESFEEFSQKYANCEPYRTCSKCEAKVKILLDRAHFDKKLDSIHRIMCQIQFEMSIALEQQDTGITSRSLHTDENEQEATKDSGIEMNSVIVDMELDADLNESFDLLTEREIMQQGSRISQNLINKFFNKYQELIQLNSASNSQTPNRIKLIRNVKQAMHAYYFQTKPKILKSIPEDFSTTSM